MDVLMPQLGETVAEGKITKWFKAAGDAVKPGDNLFEIETDKVSMEVPSITTGTLTEISVPAGEVAPVGAVVAVIAGEGGAAASAPQATPRRAKAPHAPPLRKRAPSDLRLRSPRARRRPAQPIRSSSIRSSRCARPRAITARRRLPGGTFVTPLARRLAGESGIDLARMSGSGPHGRIVARDVEAAIAKAAAAPRRWRGASAAQVKALYQGVAVRGGAARRHARDHRARGWSRPSRPSRISI